LQLRDVIGWLNTNQQFLFANLYGYLFVRRIITIHQKFCNSKLLRPYNMLLLFTLTSLLTKNIFLALVMLLKYLKGKKRIKMTTKVLKYLPDWGFAQRLLVYLREMFPIAPRLMGIGALFTIALILRLMDELKDRQTDLILFKKRPLPSGRVKERDIKFALVVVCFIYICLHFYSEQIFLSSLIVLGYTFLMFKYFFLPEKMHDCLLVNLTTHNPITVLILLHLAIIFTVQHDLSIANLNWFLLTLLIIKFWFLFLSWEIARKIRYSREETDYITYSRIFGHIWAAIISFSIQTISFGIALYLYYALSLSLVYLVLISLGYKILAAGYFWFVLKKMPTGIKLRSLAEFYAAIMMLAIIAESIWKGGL